MYDLLIVCREEPLPPPKMLYGWKCELCDYKVSDKNDGNWVSLIAMTHMVQSHKTTPEHLRLVNAWRTHDE